VRHTNGVGQAKKRVGRGGTHESHVGSEERRRGRASGVLDERTCQPQEGIHAFLRKKEAHEQTGRAADI